MKIAATIRYFSVISNAPRIGRLKAYRLSASAEVRHIMAKVANTPDVEQREFATVQPLSESLRHNDSANAIQVIPGRRERKPESRTFRCSCLRFGPASFARVPE